MVTSRLVLLSLSTRVKLVFLAGSDLLECPFVAGQRIMGFRGLLEVSDD